VFRPLALLAALPALAALAALASPAAAAVEERFGTTGALVVEFAGDPARGCAEQGLCDVRGTILVDAAPDSGGTSTVRRAQPFVRPGVLPAQVRVVRGDPDRPAGVCTDRAGAEGEPIELGSGASPARGGYLVASAGRCAGPVADDVAPALPPARIPRGYLRARRAVVDLSGARPLVSGPFSGTVRSTLRVEVTRRGVPDRAAGFGSAPRRPDRARGPRRLAVGVSYALAVRGGTALLGFAGAPAPLCELLDACGVEGSARIGMSPWRSQFGVGFSALDRRGVLRGRAAGPALDALRAGRLEVGNAGTSEVVPARLTVEMRRAGGGGTCRDERAVELALAAETDARGLTIALGGPAGSFPEGPRGPATHCGGPAAAPGRAAVAHVPRALLGRRTIDATLVPPGEPRDAADSAFTLRPAGGVPVRLTLRAVRVFEVPRP